jgi:epoxyqueuosine reductase
METDGKHEISQWIRDKAAALGFYACGISEAGFLKKDEDRLNHWLLQGYQGEMGYIARDLGKRLDPRNLIPDAKSVISVLLNYYPPENPPTENNYRITKYAYGKDHHVVIKEKLNQIIAGLKKFSGDCQARPFTDSAPVREKTWAEKAGLGHIGKNTILINPEFGSFHFIGDIITDLELEYDPHHEKDLCGKCTRCMDACPTGAITAPRLLDARRCIAYHTIESRGIIPQELKGKFNGWIFGCDTCQDVCPWNNKAKPNSEPAFSLTPGLKTMNREKWERLTREQFNDLFRHSAIKRTGFERLKRNILFLKD